MTKRMCFCLLRCRGRLRQLQEHRELEARLGSFEQLNIEPLAELSENLFDELDAPDGLR